MKWITCGAAAFLVSAAGALPAVAQTHDGPWAEIQLTSVMAGLGGQTGEGQLNLPNLGTNCAYSFKANGVAAGVGFSRITASGPVANLTRLEDFPGDYQSSQGPVTLIAGGGPIAMKNNANNVLLNLAGQTAGIGLGITGQGITIDMPVSPPKAPRTYVLEFGFNKNWVNAASRKKLNQLVDAWKCRFVKIDVAGHTDTVGKEANNLNLSELRANAVRDYLVGAGIVPGRVIVSPIGTGNQQVPTAKQVRLRSNRVVVLTISEL
jgi:outer membrane protein OmpA-like peptidoglycan-associated protein